MGNLGYGHGQRALHISDMCTMRGCRQLEVVTKLLVQKAHFDFISSMKLRLVASCIVVHKTQK